MLDYQRERIRETIAACRKVVLATGGPAGVQASEISCEAAGTELYLLVPQTSDHLFNLENDPSALLLTPGWVLRGRTQIVSFDQIDIDLEIQNDPGVPWCVLVRVEPVLLQIRQEKGWGWVETIDLTSE